MATLATYSSEEPKDVTQVSELINPHMIGGVHRILQIVACLCRRFSQNEFKELKRVFDFLCDFSPKHKLTNELKPKLEVKSKILSYKQNPGAVKLVDEHGEPLPPEDIDQELRRIDQECQEIQAKIDAIKNRTDKKVKPKDLQEALAFLGKKTHKREIEDMIWEVDENLDGCVDWEEFQLMFQRNIKDTTGMPLVVQRLHRHL